MAIAITGAAGALGSAVAKELGKGLALVDVPQAKDRLEQLAGSLAPSLALPFDIRDAAAWTDAIARAEKELGPIEGAVLVAGGWRGGEPVAESDQGDWDAMMQMNADTVQRSLHALLPGMVARKKGSVVVIGSRAVERPWTSAGAAAYAASKAAAVALAQAAAAEVLEHGVRINAVLPSTLDTPANRKAMPKADPSRWVATESAAKVIAFLLSDAARDVSGAAIPLYGRA